MKFSFNYLIYVFNLHPGEAFSDVPGDFKVKKNFPLTAHHWRASGDTLSGGK